MTDLHTHILPGMDDGSRNVTMSIDMLLAEAEQGVDTVALTPHFYYDRERPRRFLERRRAAFEQLQQGIALLPSDERSRLPELLMGAEVAWTPGIAEIDSILDLCYQDSRCIMLELPFYSWKADIFRQLSDFMNRTGLTPVIAHIDRYFGSQSVKSIEELCEFGLPMQMSAEAFSGFRSRNKAFHLMKRKNVRLIISDCHNLTDRKPNLGPAYKLIGKRLGDEAAEEFAYYSDTLLR